MVEFWKKYEIREEMNTFSTVEKVEFLRKQ